MIIDLKIVVEKVGAKLYNSNKGQLIWLPKDALGVLILHLGFPTEAASASVGLEDA